MGRMLIALLSALVAMSAVAAPLSVAARVEPASALPGIPVRLLVTVENTSDVLQTMPHLLVVRARPDGREMFIPEVLDFPVKALPEEYDDAARALKAHESRTYEIPLGGSLTSGAMADRRMWLPGTYTLQAFFHDDLRNDDVHRFGIDGLLGAGRIGSSLVASSAATLRIETPTGIDEAIWLTILEKTGNRGLALNDERSSDAIARELWTRAGMSAYMPYLLTYMRYVPRDELQAMWATVVARDPNHVVAEEIRLGQAQMKAMRAEAGISTGGELSTIVEETEAARAEIAALAHNSRHPLVQLRAAKALAAVKSRERIVELYRDIAPKR